MLGGILRDLGRLGRVRFGEAWCVQLGRVRLH